MDELVAAIESGSAEALQLALGSTRGEQKRVAIALAHREAAGGEWPVQGALCRLLRRRLPWTDQDLAVVVEVLLPRPLWCGPTLVGAVERQVEGRTPVAPLRAAMRRWAEHLDAYSGVEPTALAARLRAALGEQRRSEPRRPDPWAEAMAGAHPDAGRLTTIAREATEARPTRPFVAAAEALLDELGPERLSEAVAATIEAALGVAAPGRVPPASGDLLRGLAFLGAMAGTETAARALGELAVRGHRKVPREGPLCAKAANAALMALAEMEPGAAQLGRARELLRRPVALEKVQEAIARAAERTGITPEEFEELVVPSYGLAPGGPLERRLGAHVARLAHDGGLRFVDGNGRVRASVPRAVRDEHPDELRRLRSLARDLKQMTAAQRRRLERLMAHDRVWRHDAWRERYLDHGLVGPLARRLIWRIGSPGDSVEVIAPDGHPVDVAGRPVPAPAADTEVRLWHPIGAGTATVATWRRALEERRISQPFKQAHREVYILTDAERATGTYSNRFAAHVLVQHQLAALCRERGWRYRLQGAWDSLHDDPTLDLRRWGLRASLRVDLPDVAAAEEDEFGVFPHVVSGEVDFRDAGDGAVPLADVPPLVFSEVMRDVDLFVGVCSIGADPEWIYRAADRDPVGYWHSFAFGEMGAQAEVRREVLERLLPGLALRDVASIDGRYLRVRGKLRTYKIHLGSASVLMEPDDAYLCIIPAPQRGPRQAKVWLPFEGDARLAVIISKAFLLASDDRIEDPAILGQIRGR